MWKFRFSIREWLVTSKYDEQRVTETDSKLIIISKLIQNVFVTFVGFLCSTMRTCQMFLTTFSVQYCLEKMLWNKVYLKCTKGVRDTFPPTSKTSSFRSTFRVNWINIEQKNWHRVVRIISFIHEFTVILKYHHALQFEYKNL
jgi:hypothetical protein